MLDMILARVDQASETTCVKIDMLDRKLTEHTHVAWKMHKLVLEHDVKLRTYRAIAGWVAGGGTAIGAAVGGWLGLR